MNVTLASIQGRIVMGDYWDFFTIKPDSRMDWIEIVKHRSTR